MKRHFSKQSLLRTMMIVATLLFMMPAQNAWADNVATATVDGNTYTYSSLEAAVSAANGAQSTATVTLLKDITEQPCSLEVRKPMIIDLNNHRINTTTNYYLFYIELSMGQQMTIKNGSIRGRQNDVYIYKGEAVLENITAEAPSSGSNCVGVCNTCTLTVSKRITFDASIDNSGIVKIASGQTLYDKNGIEYSGYINSRVANLANNTLSSLVTVTANGITDTYNSLESAVSAATYAYINYGTAATVKLNHDITEQPCSLEVRKPMIIDLNGHVVNANSLTYAYGIFSIMNAEGQVIIKNGTISRRGVNNYNGFAIYNYNSNVELENVTVKNTYSTDNPCLYNNGTLTISKGITFVGSIDNSGTVQIASGQKLYDKNGIEYSGYINSRVANLANNTLSSLVTVTANGTTTPYNSLQDAVSAAANAYTTYGIAATITLNHDITEQPCSLEVRKPMIIDLNGHVVNADNLTYAYGIFSIMNAEGQVIIKNGTISRRGVNDYNGFAIYNYNSNVELENVTVKNTYSTDNPCLYNNGTLTISKNITLVGSIKNSGTVQIVDGQLLGDASGKYYLGTLTSAQVDALSNNTLSSLSVVASGSCGTDVKWALTGTSPNYILTISGTGAIPSNPWYNYRADITTVVINNGVTGIDTEFMNTPNLTSVTIPASVSYIGQQVFDGCTNLETVSGCEGVTDVGDDAFSGTKWLMDQPDGVIYIGKVAYLGKNVSGEVNIKAGTVSISSDAFNDCTNLTSITIPNSVTNIGDNAFQDCTSLTSITIPNSVTYIGSSAFKDCTSLTSITIPNGVKEIYESTFRGCTSLTSVTIPSSLERIGEAAFYNSGLTSITIPNSVMYIGANAFRGCSNLETVTVYAPNCSLGSYAFNSCHKDLQIYVFSDYLNNYKTNWNEYETKITAITPDYSGDCGKDDPQDVTWQLVEEDSHYTLYISGTGAMQDADQAHSYKMPWEDKVNKSTITNVIIGDGVTSIGSSAFSGCTGLTSVTIPASVTSIGIGAFSQTNLTTIEIPDGVTTIGEATFNGCQGLTSVIIPASVTSIGDHAFDGCTHLTTIGIPASVTSIGNGAFNGCSILEKVTIYATSVPTLGTDVFTDNKTGRKIYVFSNCVTAYKAAWSTYTNDIEAITPDYSGDCGKTNSDNVKWQLAGDNDHYTLYISGTGAMADYASENNKPWYYYSLNITSVLIEDGVTSIGNNAFKNCVDMMSVTIPNSVTSIGEYAFYYCNIKSVTIPASVESLGNKAFNSCSNLATVYLQRCTTPITTLGTEAFDDCNKLAKIYVLSDLVDTYKAATNWSKYESKIVGVYTVAFGSLPDGVSGVAPGMAAEGETVTVSFSGVPDGKVPVVSVTYGDNYEVFDVKDNGDGTFSFTMPDGNATVTASGLKNDIKSCEATVPNQSLGTNSYINYKFWDAPATIGETVTDGNTTLTLGTDYQFGSITYADLTNHSELDMPNHVGDECLVEIKGIGNYGGSKYVRFDIVNPSGSGTWGDLSWALSNGELTISGTGDMVKPQNDGTYPWLTYKSYIETITIEEGVTSIADGAFATAQNDYHYVVSTVNLPASLTSIGENAFAYCTGATITIPTGVTSIGGNAFLEVLKVIGSLNDNADNTTLVSLMHEAKRADVTISGRTLYKDGNWNTLCLPFDVDGFDYTPLQDAIVQELDVDGYYNINNPTTRYIYSYDENNHKYVYIDESGNEYKGQVSDLRQTGFDALNGTLYLYFKNASSIGAGKPYIVKWEKDSGYDANPSNFDLEDPEFTDVKVWNYATTDKAATSSDNLVQFRGIYSPTNIYSASKDNLFLGIGKNDLNEDVSMLYWPNTTDYSLGAFRAYFHVDLTGGANVREFNLNFGEETSEATIISPAEIKEIKERADAAWYSLDGRKLDAKPSSKGIYIHGGRKTVIK